MTPATSNLAGCWRLPRPIIKSHQKKKWVWTWDRVAPQNVGLPFNISAMTEAGAFKFGTLLRFAKDHHKMKPYEKMGVAVG